MKPLMKLAREQAPQFKRPDVSQFIPQGQEDAVARLVAAGHKVMYAPDMKDEVMAAVQSPDPVGKKLGENAAGVMLTLMEQAQGEIPPGAIFPAAAELMSECADLLIAAGETVTQEDWKDGFFTLIAVMGKHMGGDEQQIMGEIQKGAGRAPQPSGDEPETAAEAAPGVDEPEQMA